MPDAFAAMDDTVDLKIEPVVIHGAHMGQRITPLWGDQTPGDGVMLTGVFRREDGTPYAKVSYPA